MSGKEWRTLRMLFLGCVFALLACVQPEPLNLVFAAAGLVAVVAA